MKADVEQVIRDFRSIKYWNRRLIHLHLKLEELEHALTWGLKKSAVMTPAQTKNPYPMPSTVSKNKPAISWHLLEEKDECIKEIAKLQARILDCAFIEQLNMADLNIMFDRYWLGMSGWDAAEKYGYSRRGLNKHMSKVIDELLKEYPLGTGFS